ncbi:MAG: NADH-ubiquinone oxidoreductase-F iron-sulfur binding region domain-containing protein [Ilumatobacteraceae bacterium]
MPPVPTDPSTADLEQVVRGFAEVPGGLLPALHAVQHRVGYVPRSSIGVLADTFNLTDAEVHGVISFYHDFRTEPPTGPVVQICRAEACQARGGRAVWDAAVAAADGTGVEVREVFCLGNCALGPAVAVGDQLRAGVDAAGATSLVTAAARGSVGGHPRAATGAARAGTVTVHVPRDAAARSVGADDVAAAIAAHERAHVVRNGSRGMLWLEPMIEVSTPSGRIAYGPVTPDDVAGLLDAGLLDAADHPLRLGPVDDLPWMRGQQRVTFRRVGVIDPVDPDDYEAHGGLAGLRRALSMSPAEVVAEVTDSGLRGRGGAAFPTGIKWRTVLDAPGSMKYIVCNADEGDSGTFADRMVMEGDPFELLEGMIIAGWAVGAHEGYVYVRSEYPDAIAALDEAVLRAEQRGWLGDDVLGTGFAFRIHVRVGAGAYICGEETALLESLEGRRGVVRAKPPLPAIEGLWGRPTVVNNVLSLATVPAILADGARAYAALGTGRSRGTQVFQLTGDIARGGIVETAFGITLGELVDGFGGGTASGRPIRAVQVGGPLGAYLPVDRFDLPLDYEAFAAADALVGHGGIVVFDDRVDMLAQARFAMEFCAAESCGKCTPCRIGSTRGVELIDKVAAGIDVSDNLATLLDLCEVMTDGSLCAMGGLTPMPVRSALTHFPDDFHRGDTHAAVAQGALR